jgi:hypothetical protein
MLAALPVIIRALAQLLAMIGITWFTVEYAKAGGPQALGQTAADLTRAVGNVTKAADNTTKPFAEGSDLLVPALIVVAVLLLTK